ncbi:MAG: methyl-accepting chemotaxis protein [Deltaproteobacteria bacterium]|nr:methyl-accepting chemotaxis protein [Deltaproteobacteria bacterium]
MSAYKMRKQYFIKGPIQARYLIAMVISMLVPTLLVGAGLYYLQATLMAQQLAIPEAIWGDLVPVLNKVNWYLAIGLPIIFAIVFFYGVIISHRFAGPMFRLEKDLDQIIAGNHSVRIKFRKYDRLDNIAEKLNKVLDRLPPR